MAVGNMMIPAELVRDTLKDMGYNVTLINARFIKPIDTELIDEIVNEHSLLVTMEENVCIGGFGERVCNYVSDHNYKIKTLNISLPDDYIEHGSVDILKRETGIDSATIVNKIISTHREIEGL